MEEPKLNQVEREELAEILDRALLEGREIERLTAQYPQMTLGDSYLIQDHNNKYTVKYYTNDLLKVDYVQNEISKKKKMANSFKMTTPFHHPLSGLVIRKNSFVRWVN